MNTNRPARRQSSLLRGQSIEHCGGGNRRTSFLRSESSLRRSPHQQSVKLDRRLTLDDGVKAAAVTHSIEDKSYNQKLLDFFLLAFFNMRFFCETLFYFALSAVLLEVEAVRSSYFIEHFSASATTVSFFSVFLAFSLVFRTQVCYNR